MIANLSNLFEPIMPKSCSKLREYLQIEKASWTPIEKLNNEIKLDGIEPLFARI